MLILTYIVAKSVPNIKKHVKKNKKSVKILVLKRLGRPASGDGSHHHPIVNTIMLTG